MMMMFMIMMTMVNKFGQNFKLQKLRCENTSSRLLFPYVAIFFLPNF